ncbi:MAG: hypothetical protein KY462_16625 [Actinobacteria bacterium]|nr:hypothetical protein [Actinomycetota bacterium]
MFMDKVTTTRDAAEDVWRESRLLDDPPDSLLALLSWEEDGQVTTVSVWESAADRGQVAADRMLPLFERGVLGERHGSPHPVETVRIYLRP